jgi:hypothetical protein
MQRSDNKWVKIIFMHLKILKKFGTERNENYKKWRGSLIIIKSLYTSSVLPLMEWWKYLAFEKPSLIQYFLDFCLSRLSLYNEIGSKIPYSDPFLNNPNYHHFLSKDPQNQWPRCWNQEVLWKSRPKINIFWPKMIIKS